MENGHRNSGFSHEKIGGSFHGNMLVHQRVVAKNCGAFHSEARLVALRPVCEEDLF